MFTLTKSYEFSASYSSGDRVIAHNYRLTAVFNDISEKLESDLDGKIRNALICKIHSRDLGRDVDFLRGVSLSDASLLKAFWAIVAKTAAPATLLSLSLDREANTRWTLTETP